MNFGLATQMQDFALSLQKTMAQHMQETMRIQLEALSVLQTPAADGMQRITAGMQHIMLEQLQLLSAGMRRPMDDQVREFTGAVQRIMAEQMQIFAATTNNPSHEQLDEFISAMHDTMTEQMRFAVKMQATMTEQMQQFLGNLHQAMADVAGSGQDQRDPADD